MQKIEALLAEAVEESDADEVAQLLKNRHSDGGRAAALNWTRVDDFGQSLLHRAAEVGNVAIISSMLQYIEPESLWQLLDANGCTAAHFAVLSGNVSVVRCIVQHSSKIMEIADNNGGLPVHWAAMHGSNAAILELLVEGNPERRPQLINAKDDSAMTPLHHAASMNRVDAGRWLWENGADTTAKDDSGRTAADIAEQRSFIDFTDMLRQGA